MSGSGRSCGGIRLSKRFFFSSSLFSSIYGFISIFRSSSKKPSRGVVRTVLTSPSKLSSVSKDFSSFPIINLDSVSCHENNVKKMVRVHVVFYYGRKIKVPKNVSKDLDVNTLIVIQARLIIKKVQGKAYIRNRMRRRIKEAVRLVTRSTFLCDESRIDLFKSIDIFNRRINWPAKFGIRCISSIDELYGYSRVLDPNIGSVIMVDNRILDADFAVIMKTVNDLVLSITRFVPVH